MFSIHKMKYTRQKVNLFFRPSLFFLPCPLLLSLPPHPSLVILPVFNGTRDASAPEMSVAFGDLFQVLLVMILSIVEALPLQDLCGNAAMAVFSLLLATKKKKWLNVFKSTEQKK